MTHKYSLIPFCAANPIKFTLLSLCCLCLIFIASPVNAEPTGQLAYAVNGFDENLGRFDWNLYATALRGTKDFTAIPLNHKGMYPSWGPNGDLLYFIQRDKGHSDVYSINPDNPKNKKLVTPISGTYRFLSVSPQGRQLAFNGYTVDQLPQENQIWVLDIESGEMEVMTQVPHLGWPYSFWGISWSPNGKRLAFSLSRPGWLEHLYLLDVETKEIEVLTELNKDFYPVWAPGGDRILFLRWNREFDTFCTIDIETKEIVPLFDVDKATGYWGDWSPEGDYIAYSRWDRFIFMTSLPMKHKKLSRLMGVSSLFRGCEISGYYLSKRSKNWSLRGVPLNARQLSNNIRASPKYVGEFLTSPVYLVIW